MPKFRCRGGGGGRGRGGGSCRFSRTRKTRHIFLCTLTISTPKNVSAENARKFGTTGEYFMTGLLMMRINKTASFLHLSLKRSSGRNVFICICVTL